MEKIQSKEEASLDSSDKLAKKDLKRYQKTDFISKSFKWL